MFPFQIDTELKKNFEHNYFDLDPVSFNVIVYSQDIEFSLQMDQ